MSLIEAARRDLAGIITNTSEWANVIELIPPDGEVIIIAGTHKHHHTKIDTDGTVINDRDATVTFSEKSITDAGFSIRNQNGEVSLYRYQVSVSDASGSHTYLIREQFPDEILGLIVCVLSEVT